MTNYIGDHFPFQVPFPIVGLHSVPDAQKVQAYVDTTCTRKIS